MHRPCWERAFRGHLVSKHPPACLHREQIAFFPVAAVATSGFWPLFKPESSLARGSLSHVPNKLVHPFDASTFRPPPLPPLHLRLAHCLLAVSLVWKRQLPPPYLEPSNSHIASAASSFCCLSDKTRALELVHLVSPSRACCARSRRHRGKCRAGHCPQRGHIWDKPGLKLPSGPL